LKDLIGEKDNVIRNDEHQRNHLINTYRTQIDQRDLVLNENASYKDQYFKIFKRIIEIYSDWIQHINVFDGKNKLEIKADLNDPYQILDMMARLAQMSTPQGLQDYIKKIIVSANQLLRRYFPGAANEKFDPDKVYEKLHKYIDKLHLELKRVNPKYKEIAPDD
jgi:hypothetical protein